MIHMRIVQNVQEVSKQVVVDLPNWDGPVPRVGDYIFHPPMMPAGLEDIAGRVKVVVWRTHDRRRNGRDAEGFVMTQHPYVEVGI